jgi:hypothetical protein
MAAWQAMTQTPYGVFETFRADPLAAWLEYAALMVGCQATVAIVAPSADMPDEMALGWGLPQAETRSLAAWLTPLLATHAAEMRTLPVPVEHWPTSLARLGGANDGEVVALSLGATGWIAFLGVSLKRASCANSAIGMNPSFAIAAMACSPSAAISVSPARILRWSD